MITNEKLLNQKVIHHSCHQSYQRSYRKVDANNINHRRILTSEEIAINERSILKDGNESWQTRRSCWIHV